MKVIGLKYKERNQRPVTVQTRIKMSRTFHENHGAAPVTLPRVKWLERKDKVQ